MKVNRTFLRGKSSLVNQVILLVVSILIVWRIWQSDALKLNRALLDLQVFPVWPAAWYCVEPGTLNDLWQGALATYKNADIPPHSEAIAYFFQNYYALASNPPENPLPEDANAGLFFASIASNCTNFPRERRIGWANFAIRANPGNSLLLIKTGSTFTQLKAWNDAIPVYEKLIQMEPDYAQHRERLANAYRSTNNHRAAIDTLEESLEVPGVDKVKIYVLLSNSYYLSGDNQLAIKVLDIAEENLGPMEIYSHEWAHIFLYYRGLAQVRLGQVDVAAVNFERALSIQPEFDDAAVALSKLRGGQE